MFLHLIVTIEPDFGYKIYSVRYEKGANKNPKQKKQITFALCSWKKRSEPSSEQYCTYLLAAILKMIVFFPSLSQLKFLGFSIVENITKRVCMFASWKGKSMCVYTHTTHNQWIHHSACVSWSTLFVIVWVWILLCECALCLFWTYLHEYQNENEWEKINSFENWNVCNEVDIFNLLLLLFRAVVILGKSATEWMIINMHTSRLVVKWTLIRS